MTAVITGATRGIGRACAKMFFDAGYHMIGVYRSSEDIADAMSAEGYEMYRCDVSDSESVADMCSVIHTADVLVNCAGIARQQLFTDVRPSDWDAMMDVNVKGMYNMIHALLPKMIREKYGRIVNISSMWGEVGASCEVPYSASKAAVIGMTKALAKEVGPSGITVNCVAPGFITTDMTACFDEDVVAAVIEDTPVGRIGTPYDVARAVMFLADKDSGFITGQVLGVSGGYVI